MTQNPQQKTDNKMRFFDDDGYRSRSACICIDNESEDQILLITSHRDQTSWIIPGGGLEPNETTIEAAHRELYEEAGVKGEIIRQLGLFDNHERKHRTTVFVVRVIQEFDDWEDKRLFNRQRHWYSIDQAVNILKKSKPTQIQFIQQFVRTSPNQIRLNEKLSSLKDSFIV